jgi:hypothetical protein
MVARVTFKTLEALQDVFVDVTEAWGLSQAERQAVRNGLPSGLPEGERPCEATVAERMALVTEIDLLMDDTTDITVVRAWIRKGLEDTAAGSPLEHMLGTTARLRCLRDRLAGGTG